MRADLVVVGDAYVDVTLPCEVIGIEPGTELLAPIDMAAGGSAGYLARALAAIGHEVAVAATVGGDALGQFWVENLARHGVDIAAVRRVPGSETGLSVVVPVDGDRSFITRRGANCAAFTPDQLSDVHPSILVVCGFLQAPGLWGPEFEAFLANWRAAHPHASMLLDPNLGDLDPRGLDALSVVLRAGYINFLLPNRAELLVLSGRKDPERAAEALATRYGVTVVAKLDRDGALLVEAARSHRIPTRPVRVANANANGDIFAAAFCDGLARSLNPAKAAEIAVEVASRAAAARSMDKKFAEVTRIRREVAA